MKSKQAKTRPIYVAVWECWLAITYLCYAKYMLCCQSGNDLKILKQIRKSIIRLKQTATPPRLSSKKHGSYWYNAHLEHSTNWWSQTAFNYRTYSMKSAPWNPCNKHPLDRELFLIEVCMKENKVRYWSLSPFTTGCQLKYNHVLTWKLVYEDIIFE